MTLPTFPDTQLSAVSPHTSEDVGDLLKLQYTLDLSLISTVVQSRTTVATPTAPTTGDVYVVPASGVSGEWVGHEGEVAAYYNGWGYVAPKVRVTVFVVDEVGQAIWYDGSAWVVREMRDAFFNGTIQESVSIVVQQNGANVEHVIDDAAASGLIHPYFDGIPVAMAVPSTLNLSVGTAAAPTLNYVWLEESGGVVTQNSSTSGWPSTPHAPLSTVLVQDAAGVGTDGAYKVHAWTDHIASVAENGHLAHLNKKVRAEHADWDSGSAPTLTITPGSPDSVDIAIASGVAFQLHTHAVPAFDTATGSIVYVINDSVTPYTQVTDLASLLTDSAGGSMSSRYFSLVLWIVVSELSGDCKLMCNLPDGSYLTRAAQIADGERFTRYEIPPEFRGTGILNVELQLKHAPAGGGTWTEQATIDLRGNHPSSAAGSGTTISSEFSDAAFRVQDNADATKEIALEASAIATATTRTGTMPDKDVTFGLDADAIHDNVAGEILAITAKAAPTISELILCEDAAASYAKKRISIKTLLKTHYAAISSVPYLNSAGDLSSHALAADILLGSTTGVSIQSYASTAGSIMMRRAADGNHSFVATNDALEEFLDVDSGTSFPGTPTDGKRFYHETHLEWFTYSSADSGWLGDGRYTIYGSVDLALAATNYLAYGFDIALIQFSSTVGYNFPFATKVVEMGIRSASATVTIFVRDDGANVTSASIALAAATNNSSMNIASATIAADSCIGFYINAGTTGLNTIAHAVLRRFET